MRLELIQPFINAADAVLGHTLAGSTRIRRLSMEPHAYRRRGIAAVVTISGDIEGRIIFDLEPQTAEKVATLLFGELPESEELVRETICELANQVIGNAVCSLNDQGFHLRPQLPQVHSDETGLAGSEDTEAVVMGFDTPSGPVFMNIALKYRSQ